MSRLTQTIKEYARELGFSAAGIVPALPSPQLDAYLRWLDRGMHGSMGYMGRADRVARRKDLTVILPQARSLVVVAFDYHYAAPAQIAINPSRGRISNYAWGADYHQVMGPRLKRLAEMIRSHEPGARWRAYVDTGAILERSHAAQARLGFVGKNTMLIHPRRGSYFFLGEIITSLELDYDEPIQNRMPGCGTCTRCLATCPTSAFAEPYVLDARRCISYLTIEHRDTFDIELRPLVGRWVYGCDVCQEVCPWQRFANPSGLPELMPFDIERASPRLDRLLALTHQQFDQTYRNSAIHRIGRDKMISNACIAAGNSGQPELSELLIPLLQEPDHVVRSHAAWALGRLGQAATALGRALLTEADDRVQREIKTALKLSS